MGYRIGLDLGHTLSGADYGASGIKEESILTRELGTKVMNLFKALGHTVVNCTIDNASTLNQSLSYRCNTANANNVDYYISIHFNAFDGTAHGTEILYYNTPDERMNRVLNNICALGFYSRGLKQRTGLYVLKHTNMKAMLIETCFCDNASDMNRYDANKVAKAIVEGFLGTTVNNTPINNTKPVEGNNSKISTHLRDFQRAYNQTYDKNISVDGIYGPETEDAIQNTLVKYGNKNALVGYVQCRVGASVDNVFGNKTKQAVINFQKENGLTQDGIVGKNTLKTILKKYNW